MKTLAAIALVALTLGTAASAQTNTLTGKWTGTMTGTRPDGSQATQNIEFNIDQKGAVVTGTGGPNAERQWKIEKGTFKANKASFQIQQENGPLFTFTLTLAKGHLQGDMVGVQGETKREFKVDVTKAPAAKK